MEVPIQQLYEFEIEQLATLFANHEDLKIIDFLAFLERRKHLLYTTLSFLLQSAIEYYRTFCLHQDSISLQIWQNKVFGLWSKLDHLLLMMPLTPNWRGLFWVSKRIIMAERNMQIVSLLCSASDLLTIYPQIYAYLEANEKILFTKPQEYADKLHKAPQSFDPRLKAYIREAGIMNIIT